MPDRYPPIATPAEIRSIFLRAQQTIDDIGDRVLDDDEDLDDEERRVEENVRLGAAVEAMRFCCVAAGLTGDASLLPLVADAIRTQEDFDDHAWSHLRVMAEGLMDLLRAGAPVDAEVEEIARHHDAEVRRAVASGLRPRGERAIALLEGLAADPVPEVRNAARSTLSAVREVHWWQGKLRSDPAERLDPAEALALKPTFERLSELLDQPRYAVSRHDAELASLAAALPDPLLVELVEVMHAATDAYGTRHIPLLTLMLGRDGGVEAFIRLCGVWGAERGYVDGSRIAPALAALPGPRRVEVCRRLAAWAAALPEKQRSRDDKGPARLVAEVVGMAWPPGEDLTPILDALLSIPQGEEHALDWVVSGLGKALSAEGADPAPVLDRALEARMAGYPGRWRSFRHVVERLLERATGPALRLAAEQAALADDDDLRTWGVARLLGGAHDPDRDGPLPEVAARFVAEPRTRRVITATDALARRALPALRAELRAGRLEYAEAAAVLRAIGALWSGVADGWYPLTRLLDDAEREPARAKEREALAAHLGPPEMQGPPTGEEWAALRAARARAMEQPGGAPGAGYEDTRKGQPPIGLAVLPAGPWDPEDRAALESALARLRAGDGDASVPIATALVAKAQPEDLPLFEELLARSPDDARSLVKMMRGTLREALGMPRSPTPAEAGSDADAEDDDDEEGDEAAREWMDEDD